MSKNNLPDFTQSDQKILLEEIRLLKQELESLEKHILNFEILLRSHIGELIVESQELFVLYKQIKKAKKAKRLEQKKRGKNYQESNAIRVVSKVIKKDVSTEQQKEKKRLYKEAMLHVHPDKFYMDKEETDVATEVTSRLIEIYKTESLETLQAYHAHIFKGNTAVVLGESALNIKVVEKVDYLQQEKERLEKGIVSVRDSHLYKVLTEYDNPLTFVDELKGYYKDRIFKLRKRTRKGL